MMLFRKKTVVLMLIIFFSLVPLGQAWAQTIFNPHNLISNIELTDYTTMTLEDIYDFLKNKGGYLHNYIDPNVKMITPQVIHDAAWTYQINPRYILVLLQKEQSLVTDPLPRQGKLDWATGYGVCDDCSVTDPKIQKYKGLANQIDWGAGATRYYLENPQKFTYQTGKTYDIDGTQVTMMNDATRALYTYTPHLHGNQNLVKIWSEWFSKNYPDGSLLQAADGGIWLIQNNLKRPFLSKAAFASRYSFDKVIGVSDDELEKYEIGAPIKYSNYSLLRIPSGGIYLLDGDYLRPITSSKAFKLLGFNPEEVVDIEESEVSNYALGEAIDVESSYPTGGLLQDNSSGGVYYVENGKKHPIWSKGLMNLYYSHLKLTAVSPEELTNYETMAPVKFEDGELVKSDLSPEVYVISNGKKLPIVSEKAFRQMGYKWENVIVTTNKILSLHETGSAITAEE